MAGTRSRAREAEQEHALVEDAGHHVEPSKDSGTHLGEAAGMSERRETTDSGNLPTSSIATGYRVDSNLELESRLNRITEPEVNTTIKQSPRRGLRRAATLQPVGCIGTRATQKTSELSRSFSNGDAKIDKVKVKTKPKRQNAKLLETEGADTDGASLLVTKRNDTLSKIHYVISDRTWTSILSGNRDITVDLPLVANIVHGSHKQANQVSASRVLDDLRKKNSWKLGTQETILNRFAANSVPLLHKTMMLLDLKAKLSVILEEWMKETPPLSPT